MYTLNLYKISYVGFFYDILYECNVYTKTPRLIYDKHLHRLIF